jgi:hypothetical protein
MSCRQQRKAIDRLFLGEDSPSAWPTITAHLKTCEGCARYYDRTALAMRALSGRPSDPSPEELRPIGIALAGTPAAGALRAGRWSAALAVAATLGLAVLFTVRHTAQPVSEVTSRGTSVPIDVQVRGYCLREVTPGHLSVVAVSSEDTGHLSCGVTDYLQFSHLLRGDKPMYLAIVGRTASGETLHYYPRAEDETGVRINPTGREEPLPGSIRLAARHHPGPVDVAAVVSGSALSGQAAAALLDARNTPPDVRVLRLHVEVSP